ncbi:MAG TPA: mannosyltransferase family protein [Verrucomicrobiae bacterium]|nr:mannosyltransferase family protein [Verrucomicrobiae bacterium]
MAITWEVDCLAAETTPVPPWKRAETPAVTSAPRVPWRVLSAILAWKGFWAVFTLLVILLPGFNVAAFNLALQRWPRDAGPVITSHLATWDAAHYLFLSEVGYVPGTASCAFYPLWPNLIRLGSNVTGGNHLISGLLLANVFSAVAGVLFYRLVSSQFGNRVAWLSLLLLLLFPGSLFFQFIYSESLFFLLLVGLWTALSRRQDLPAAALAFLLPLTRGVGIFSAVPLAWYVLEPVWNRCQALGRGLPLRRRLTVSRAVLLQWAATPRLVLPAALLLLAPFLGFMVYLGFMALCAGGPLEGIRAQRFWGVQSAWNLVNVPGFVWSFFHVQTLHDFSGSGLDRAVFVFFLLSLPTVWRLGRGLSAWALALGLLPAMSGHFVSFTRFCAVALPVFVALGVWLGHASRRRLLAGYAIASLAIQLVLGWCFLNFYWAG